MPPAFARRGQLFRRALRVVDEDVGASRELPQIIVELGHARFVVGGIHDCSRRRFQAISQAALRMIQPARGHFRALHFELVAARDFRKLAARVHQRQIHREIRARELRFQDLSQTVAAEIFRLEAVKVEIVLRQIERAEKRHTLNVIPMVVRDENVRLLGAVAIGICPMIPEHAYAGAAIEDETRSVRRNDIDARRISAVAPHSAIERRNGTANSPESQFCDVAVHRRGFRLSEKSPPPPRCERLKSISS